MSPYWINIWLGISSYNDRGGPNNLYTNSEGGKGTCDEWVPGGQKLETEAQKG